MIREVSYANKQYFCLNLLMKFDSLQLLQMQSFGVLVEQNLNGQKFCPTIGDNSLKFGTPSASTVYGSRIIFSQDRGYIMLV